MRARHTRRDEYVLLAALVEAALVKVVVGALTGFTISLPRALAAGLVAGAAGLAPPLSLGIVALHGI